MVNPVRLPLVENTEPRLSDSEKDGLTANLFFEKAQNGSVYATKRPGLTSNITGSGQAQGVFTYDGQVFNFNLPFMNWIDVIWSGTKFCAITNKTFMNTGYPSMSITSTDGLDWQQGSLPSETYWNCVGWNGNVFCALAEGNSGGPRYIATATDGLTWTSRTPVDVAFEAIANNGTRFVAVGGVDGTAYSAYSTDDGVTWSTGNLGSSNWTAVAYNSSAGVFCAVSANATTTVSTSPTGAVWTNRVIAAGNRYGIASNGTIFVASTLASGVGTNKCHTSPDGVTWTERTLPSVQQWSKVAWTGSHFIMLGEQVGSTLAYVMAYSTDGITWAQTAMPTLTGMDSGTSFYSCLAGNTGMIVSLGAMQIGNEYAYSTDDAVSFTLGDLERYWIYPDIN